ncbi:MAG: hypothetical protein AAGA22_01375, partial [Pseudomonadota bacterium]
MKKYQDFQCFIRVLAGDLRRSWASVSHAKSSGAHSFSCIIALAFFVAPTIVAAQEGPSSLAGDYVDAELLEEAIASAENEDGTTEDVDPWIGFNKDMFAVQDFLDQNLLVPVALGYRA